jgi:hypothetical protein
LAASTFWPRAACSFRSSCWYSTAARCSSWFCCAT